MDSLQSMPFLLIGYINRIVSEKFVFVTRILYDDLGAHTLSLYVSPKAWAFWCSECSFRYKAHEYYYSYAQIILRFWLFHAYDFDSFDETSCSTLLRKIGQCELFIISHMIDLYICKLNQVSLLTAYEIELENLVTYARPSFHKASSCTTYTRSTTYSACLGRRLHENYMLSLSRSSPSLATSSASFRIRMYYLAKSLQRVSFPDDAILVGATATLDIQS